MIEELELQCLRQNNFKRDTLYKSDSEEYHEIGHEVLQETLDSPKCSVIPVKEFDFFTKYDTGASRKSTKRKKPRKKENKAKTITDVIGSELASKELLLENHIVLVDSDDRNMYLEKTLTKQIFKSTAFRSIDAENGFSGHLTDCISPVFPKVLENNVIEETGIPVQYVEPSLFSNVVSEYIESGTKQTPKFLDIIIKNIIFKHHHEFSLEKLCSIKLIDYYKNYETTAIVLQDLIKKIDVARRTRIGLKEKLQKISPNKKEDVKYDKNVMKYTKAMLELKEKYYRTLEEQKKNVHRIISLWGDIESIRDKSGLIKTDCFLEIADIEIEQKEFEKQWNQAFENEYSDMIVKIEYDFLNKCLEYRALKLHSNKNDEINKIIKPRLEIDYQKLKVEVESLVNSLVLKNNVNLLLKRDRSLINYPNKKRKTSFANNYCFKIYVDNVYVCESDNYICKEDQSDIDFIEYLSIEILPHNKFTSIVLYENEEKMSSIQILLSDVKQNTNETSLKYNFIFDKTEEPSSRNIGCGFDIKEIAGRNRVRLKSSNIFKGKLWTNCDVNLQIGWNHKYNDYQFESIKSHMDFGNQIKQLLLGKSEPRIQKVTEIINYLYVTNIEDNQNITAALNDICKMTLLTNNDFNFDEKDLDITRLQLLRLRLCGGLLELENRTVPLFTSQMSTELLDCLQKSENKDVDYHIKRETDNSIDVQRYIGMKFIEKLNINIIKKVNDHLLKITYKDVVRDFEDLSLRSLLTNQANLSWSTATSGSKQKLIKDYLMKEQEIYITVYKAHNLMCRSSSTSTEDEIDSDNIAGFKMHSLRPFVQVGYHGLTTQTATAIGCHPSWNHTIRIKTRLEPLSTIHLNIYDQCKEHLNRMHSDDPSTQSTVIYRKFNRWLGSISIPIHTVLSMGNVRGTFKINVPPMLFGYENSPKQSESTFSELSQLLKREKSFLSLQVTTSLSHLGGFQTYHQPITNDTEDDFIIRHLNEFVTEYVNDFPGRNISLTFIDSTGKNKCVSGFLQAIPVPNYESFPIDPKKLESARSKSSGYSKSTSSKSSRKKSLTDDKEPVSVETWRSDEIQLMKYIDAVVRYVSLIPTYEVTDTHVVTLMGVELLKMVYGSPLDHTILLASYFIHLEIKCWVIIGFALPRGLSSYVLVQHYHNKILKSNDQIKARSICGGSEGFVWYIYDAVGGERYDLRENECPLKTVSYVFDLENIWVNVQSTQDCESVSFNFSKSSDWQTVFNKPLFITRPIHECLYSKPEDVESLRISLETKIKNKIQKWRSHVKTIWNRYCSSLLREMLPHWEFWSFNPAEPRTNPGHRLKQLMVSYKIYGFPLNMPYLNSKLIISKIKSTAVHINDDPTVEFGLGVDVYAYANNVLSVWVFLASITRI